MSVESQTKPRLLKVLHIGVSNRGEWPLKLCNESTGFVPAALCDVSQAALEKARLQTGLPESACYTDVDTALAHSKVDCAVICTPTVLHVPLCKKAIDAGLPVLVEKGMAPSWSAALELASKAKEKQAIAAVAQNYRYFGIERTIWRAIHDVDFPAYLGKVHLLTYTQNRVRPQPRTLNYPFASVWDMSCHHFDNLLYWLGPIAEMSAFSWRAHWSAYEYDNNTAAHMVFADQTRCHYLHTHDAARNTLEVQIHGERGALVRTDDALTFNTRPLEQFGVTPTTPVAPEKGQGEADLLRDFHAYIVDGVEPGISVANNLETMAACEMMVRSITNQKTCHRSELNV
jgi:predicted dehydrogenase